MSRGTAPIRASSVPFSPVPANSSQFSPIRYQFAPIPANSSQFQPIAGIKIAAQTVGVDAFLLESVKNRREKFLRTCAEHLNEHLKWCFFIDQTHVSLRAIDIAHYSTIRREVKPEIHWLPWRQPKTAFGATCP